MKTSISLIVEMLKQSEFHLSEHEIESLDQLIYKDSALDSMFEFSNEAAEQLTSVIQFLLLCLE